YEKSFEGVNIFWRTVNEEIVKSKIRKEQNKYYLTVVTNVNKQMGAYVSATTSRFTKRLLENAKESQSKRVAKVNSNLQENFEVLGFHVTPDPETVLVSLIKRDLIDEVLLE
ncbi:5372_t:CDS:2, partial [Dentiscutata erythropus]